MNFTDKAKRMLIVEEGKRTRPYDDATGATILGPVGHVTIGVGRNLDNNPLSDAAILFLLNEDIEDALEGIIAILPDFDTMSENRQLAVVNMVINMGVSRFVKFHNLIGALKVGEWETAAMEVIKSDYAKKLPSRAARVSRMIADDVYLY